MFEVESGFPGLRNFVVPVPGSDVTCHLGVFDDKPEDWVYSLWTGEGNAEITLCAGWLDLTGLSLRPEQVANVAFMLEVDYAL